MRVVQPEMQQEGPAGGLAHVPPEESDRGVGQQPGGVGQERVVGVGIEVVRGVHRRGSPPAGSVAEEGPDLVEPVGGDGWRVATVDRLAAEDSPAAAAEMPLAEERGAVTGGLQRPRQRGGAGIQPVRHPAARVVAQPGEVRIAVPARGVLAGHRRDARGRADGMRRVELQEPRAVGGQPVEMRRPDSRVAVAAEIAVAEVVGQNEEEVGARGGSRCGTRELGRAGGERGEEDNEREAGHEGGCS